MDGGPIHVLAQKPNGEDTCPGSKGFQACLIERGFEPAPPTLQAEASTYPGPSSDPFLKLGYCILYLPFHLASSPRKVCVPAEEKAYAGTQDPFPPTIASI